MKPKVKFYRDAEGWNYTVSRFQPPHDRTTHTTGPFRWLISALLDFWRFKRGGYV